MLAPFSIEELSDEMSYPPIKDRNQKKKRNIKPLILIILAILVILVGIFFGYVSDFYKGVSEKTPGFNQGMNHVSNAPH